MIDTFKGKIAQANGYKELKIGRPDIYQTALNGLKLDQDVWLTLDTRKPKRSDAQNRLYWMYLHMIEEETGNENLALHEYFKQEYGYGKVVKVNDPLTGLSKDVFVPVSTRDMNRAEFSMYLLKIEEATGIEIPDTESYIEREMYKSMSDSDAEPEDIW